MRTTARTILLFSAGLLVLYPLWGLLQPTSFVTELSEHYAFAEGVSDTQVRASAAMLWISNGTLAIALFALAQLISSPARGMYARLAGAGLILYPVLRTVVEVWSGLNLTSHATGVEVAIHLSSEKLFFIVFGLAILGLYSAWVDLNRSQTRSAPAPAL